MGNVKCRTLYMHIQYVQQPMGLQFGPQTRISDIKQAVSPCFSIVLKNFNKWRPAHCPGKSRLRFTVEPLEFFIDLILPATPWPWDRLSLWQKWASGIFLGG